MKRSPAITASRRPRSRATWSDSTPRPVAGGEDGGQVRRPEPPRRPAAAGAGGPPVAGEDPGGAFPGRARLMGEAGPEARRSHHRRGVRRRPALVVELGEVGGEGLVVDPSRVPTTFVQKYTPRAQLKPSGAPEPGLRARETGGGGRPARFCQEQMGVMTEQFSSMEHDAFHVPYLSDTIREAAFHGQAVKTVAYLRVSTPQQDVSSQRLAILEYARKHDLHIDDFIEAASGQASEKRRRLDELTNALRPGDRLVVSELSRLGRSLGQVVNVLDALAKAGVAFVALKENIRVEGKRDIQTKVMTTLFALFAEVERDLISERTREGLARARSSGRKLGRPKGSLGVSRLDGKEDEIRRFLELGVSKTAIAKLTGVSRTALYSFMTTRGLRPSR